MGLLSSLWEHGSLMVSVAAWVSVLFQLKEIPQCLTLLLLQTDHGSGTSPMWISLIPMALSGAHLDNAEPMAAMTSAALGSNPSQKALHVTGLFDLVISGVCCAPGHKDSYCTLQSATDHLILVHTLWSL